MTTYTIKTDKLNKSIKIVFLSDLHSCIYGENQVKLISRIYAQNPDLILMSGDIADDKIPIAGTVELLKYIKNKDNYYVTGNHEFRSGRVDEIKSVFREYGVNVLEGECKTVEIGEQRINICGIDDPEIGDEIFSKQLEKAFSFADSNLFTILLSHRPERFRQESAYKCDLILSGHAHGGQWRIPFTPISAYAPNQGFFPKYTSGMYTMNGVKMLVSRGLYSRVKNGIPRIFNPTELIVINIIPE